MITKRELLRAINQPEYDILRTDSCLQRTMLLTIGGSLAYGTDINTTEHQSDLDLRGVWMHSKEEILSMSCQNKPIVIADEMRDIAVYPLKQMIDLLSDCNPNVVEILGTLDEHIIYCNAAGQLLRDNLDLFLTQKAYYTFGGMARNNLRLMKNILTKHQISTKDKAQFTVDSLATVLNNALGHYNSLHKQTLNIGINQEITSESYLDYIELNGKLEGLAWNDFKSLFGELNNVIRGYDKQSLNKRNAKKDEVHMHKHIMHTIRVLKMGCEILRGEGLQVYRHKDRAFLLDIRKGVYSTDELLEMTDQLEAELTDAKTHTSLPVEVDKKKVRELTIELTKMCLNEEKSFCIGSK